MREIRPCWMSCGGMRSRSTVSAKRSSHSGSNRTGGTRVVRNVQQRDRLDAWWRAREGKEERASSAARASGTRTSPARLPAGTRSGAVPCAGKASCAGRTAQADNARNANAGAAVPLCRCETPKPMAIRRHRTTGEAFWGCQDYRGPESPDADIPDGRELELPHPVGQSGITARVQERDHNGGIAAFGSGVKRR